MTRDFENDAELGDEQISDLLDDIEIRCSADLAAARGMTTVRRKVAVEVRPGNASDRGAVVARVDTTEIRSRSITTMADVPVMVGDVLHLTFDRNALDVVPVLAVCDRCTMLGDASFEVRFQFVHEIALPTDPE